MSACRSRGRSDQRHECPPHQPVRPAANSPAIAHPTRTSLAALRSATLAWRQHRDWSVCLNQRVIITNSLTDTRQRRVPPAGFEPATPSLGERSGRWLAGWCPGSTGGTVTTGSGRRGRSRPVCAHLVPMATLWPGRGADPIAELLRAERLCVKRTSSGIWCNACAGART